MPSTSIVQSRVTHHVNVSKFQRFLFQRFFAIFLNQNPLGDYAGVGITLQTPLPFVNKVTDSGDSMSPNYGLKSYSFVNFSLSRRTMTILITGTSALSATSSHLSGHITFVFSYETKHNIDTIT